MTEFEEPTIILPADSEVTSEAVKMDFTTARGRKSFVVVLGDLTQVNADAIACPANPGFEFAGFGGVQTAVERAAGIEVFDEAEAKAKLLVQTEDGVEYEGYRGLSTGYAISTKAGRLASRYKNIIHVNSMPRRDGSILDDIEVVRISVDRALEVAERLSLRSIALPAFGTGMFGMDLRDSLLGTLSGVRAFFGTTRPDAALERILFVVYAQPSISNAQVSKRYIQQQLS